jgi:GntR family transcriptional regulator / MocR family aminotransferase
MRPGDKVAFEDPGYLAVRHLFAQRGLTVVPVPVDRDGLRVDTIPPDVKMVFTTHRISRRPAPR